MRQVSTHANIQNQNQPTAHKGTGLKYPRISDCSKTYTSLAQMGRCGLSRTHLSICVSAGASLED